MKTLHRCNLIFVTMLASCFSAETFAGSLGQTLSGMGNVGRGMREAEREMRMAERERAELEIRRLELEKLRREDEQQRLEHEEKMRGLSGNQVRSIDFFAAERALRKSLPLNLGGNSQLVNVEAVSADRFIFSYKLGDLDYSLVDTNEFNQQVGSDLINYVCADPYWGGAVRQGKYLQYNYFDRFGVRISSLYIQGNVCR